MNPLRLVRPLEASWNPVLDDVLRERGAPPTSDVARLAPKVTELSRAYNAGLAGGAHGPAAGRNLPLEARIAFSFARDVPKGAAAVRELVATGALAVPEDRPLRILDLGAGLGAMTWGIVRALEASGARGGVEALLVDEDEAALAAARSIADHARAKLGERPLSLTVRTRSERLRRALPVAAADVVVLGQVLCELDHALAPDARVAEHAALLDDWLQRTVAPGGVLVVVEPALRERTRHLLAVRDRLLATSAAAVFAPCLHAAPCPILATPDAWCHDDLPVDLPSWLVPLARASGLRFQGLTFSYLVLRRRGADVPATLGERLDPPDPSRVRLRVVSSLLRTKGKTELFGCTEGADLVRLRRLDREASDASAAWDDLSRGDVVELSAPTAALAFDERGRTSPHLRVDVWPFRH